VPGTIPKASIVADSAEATGLKWQAPAGSSGPAFSAYRATTAQTFSASTATKIEFNAENFDTDNCFDSTTNYRFTPNKAGKYQISAQVRIESSSTVGRTLIYFYKNGSIFLVPFDTTIPYDAYEETQSILIDMNGTTDYLEVYAQAAGAGLSFIYNTGGRECTFTGVWIRS
jgi:hypothetical protein